MSKYANPGELRTKVFFKRIERSTDDEGFPSEQEINVFGQDIPVRVKWVNAHGTETFTAMQLKLREPATITMRYSPKINVNLLVYKASEMADALRAGDNIADEEKAENAVKEALERVRYEIISIDNVEERNRWMEIKVQRKVAAR